MPGAPTDPNPRLVPAELESVDALKNYVEVFLRLHRLPHKVVRVHTGMRVASLIVEPKLASVSIRQPLDVLLAALAGVVTGMPLYDLDATAIVFRPGLLADPFAEPVCAACGTPLVRNGSCWKCPNDGTTTGCT